MGNLTISMAIFSSYVSLPEGIPKQWISRAPVRSLRRYGGWKAAWQSVGVTPEDLITVAPWRSGWWAPWRSKKGWLNCLEFYLTFYLAGGESKQKPGLL